MSLTSIKTVSARTSHPDFQCEALNLEGRITTTFKGAFHTLVCTSANFSSKLLNSLQANYVTSVTTAEGDTDGVVATKSVQVERLTYLNPQSSEDLVGVGRSRWDSGVHLWYRNDLVLKDTGLLAQGDRTLRGRGRKWMGTFAFGGDL